MRIAAISFALVGMMLSVVPAAAVDRLVDDALVPCTADPVPIHATIGAAVTAAADGETIVVCPGTYMEFVNVDKADLTLQARGLVKIVSPGTPGNGVSISASGVTFQGFQVSGFDATNTCGVITTAPDSVIRNNKAHHNNFGICGLNTTDYWFLNNVAEANVANGIVSQNGSGELSGNTVRGNGQAGISVFGCSGALTIHHNLATDNGLDGIFAQTCGAEIRNNTVRNPGTDGRGILIFQTTGAVVTRNSVQTSSPGILVQNSTGGTVSFNSVSFNTVGIDLVASNGFTLTRNVVSRSTTVDCRWDGSGTHTFLANSCTTEIPAGAWD